MIDEVYKKKFASGADAGGANTEQRREGTFKLGRPSEKAAAESKDKKKGGCCK